MKTSLLHFIMIIAFASVTLAVKGQSTTDEAGLKTFWNNLWEAYTTGNAVEIYAHYTENATMTTPDGNTLVGKHAIIDSWNEMVEMIDEKPKFTYSNLTISFSSKDMASLSWDNTTDIKIEGKQIGTSVKETAVVHRLNGIWLIESDFMRPLIQMSSN